MRICENGIYRDATEEEMRTINKHKNDELAENTPTTEDRLSTLEDIETQQDESITEIFEALFGAESEAES